MQYPPSIFGLRVARSRVCLKLVWLVLAMQTRPKIALLTNAKRVLKSRKSG
jgi:hypothetical protein